MAIRTHHDGRLPPGYVLEQHDATHSTRGHLLTRGGWRWAWQRGLSFKAGRLHRTADEAIAAARARARRLRHPSAPQGGS